MPEEQPALSCASFRTQLRFLVALSAISSCIGQLQQLLTALEVSGKLPNATRTVAGFTAHTLCEGKLFSHTYSRVSMDRLYSGLTCAMCARARPCQNTSRIL